MDALIHLLNNLKVVNRDACAKRIAFFFNELIVANACFNLTGITDETEAEQKHFIDSLTAYPWLKAQKEKKQGDGFIEVLDIGAGAGFPSIPLAVCIDDIRFTLVESVGKKTSFLEHIKNALGLENVTVIKSRAEDLPKNKKYDITLGRGVAPLNTLCEYSLPFLKTEGRMVAFKGQKADEEISAAQNALLILGGAIENKISYTLNVGEEVFERALIIIKKVSETDEKYPRAGNKPRLKPL